jgi:hypothetical protein
VGGFWWGPVYPTPSRGWASGSVGQKIETRKLHSGVRSVRSVDENARNLPDFQWWATLSVYFGSGSWIRAFLAQRMGPEEETHPGAEDV